MSGVDDDDKPTVVLDLNALKKQKLNQEEYLANIAHELEFSVGSEEVAATPITKAPSEVTRHSASFTVVLFDFQSDFFEKSFSQFPKGFDYQIARTLPELNKCLSSKKFQIVAFNYDVNPKAVNQLTAQIKQKFSHSKTIIMAKAISPEKAKIHAQTPSGANGYYQYPLVAKNVESEFLKIHEAVKKVG
jgi:hypothetical protein